MAQIGEIVFFRESDGSQTPAIITKVSKNEDGDERVDVHLFYGENGRGRATYRSRVAAGDEAGSYSTTVGEVELDNADPNGEASTDDPNPATSSNPTTSSNPQSQATGPGTGTVTGQAQQANQQK